jgi:hypothetical protein
MRIAAAECHYDVNKTDNLIHQEETFLCKASSPIPQKDGKQPLCVWLENEAHKCLSSSAAMVR